MKEHYSTYIPPGTAHRLENPEDPAAPYRGTVGAAASCPKPPQRNVSGVYSSMTYGAAMAGVPIVGFMQGLLQRVLAPEARRL
jgi:hypothetical protein